MLIFLYIDATQERQVKVYISNNNVVVVVVIVIVSMVISSTSTATNTKVTERLPTTTTTTTNIETETDVRSGLELEADEEAQAVADTSKSKPIKRIKLKRVPSALNLSRRPSILLQRTSSIMLRKRGEKKKSGNFHYRSRPAEIEEIDVDVQDEISKAKSSASSSPKRLTPWINYEVFQWAWFLTLCILAIADRFTWNVWPRQTYTIGAGSAGSDRLSGYKPG